MEVNRQTIPNNQPDIFYHLSPTQFAHQHGLKPRGQCLEFPFRERPQRNRAKKSKFDTMSPAQFGNFMEKELAKWGRVVKEGGIKPQ